MRSIELATTRQLVRICGNWYFSAIYRNQALRELIARRAGGFGINSTYTVRHYWLIPGYECRNIHGTLVGVGLTREAALKDVSTFSNGASAGMVRLLGVRW